MKYLVNDVDAAKLILNDRDVSASKTVREAVSPQLEKPAQAEVAYVGEIGALPLKPTYIGPTGSTAVQDITNRALSDTLFGRKSPAEAAGTWMSESEQAITQ